MIVVDQKAETLISHDKKPEVTRAGALDMQVCVPADWSDAQVKDFADTNNTCGTEHGWAIRKEGSKHLAGDPERAQCSDRKGFVHVTLDA